MSHRPKVLAIDDILENLMVLATALEKEFDFQLASSGARGLALAQSDPPDLILLDVMMPEMDGFETCRHLKENPALSAVPVIFITALSDVESEVLGLAAGGADFITKPIRVDLVRQRMLNILKLTSLSRQLKFSEERLRHVMAATGDGIWDWDVQSGMVFHNAKWCEMLGLPANFMEHSLEVFAERIHPDHAENVKASLDACFQGADFYNCEYQLQHSSGDYIWISDHGKVVQRDPAGKPLRMVGSIRDISDRQRHEAEIRQLAFYDPLTQLPNRRLMMDRLKQATNRIQRSKKISALMFLDMDRFKELNDTLGHAMGDLLLQEVARRLSAGVRQSDTVARLGGDEFVVLLDNLHSDPDVALENAKVVANKLLQSLNQPYDLRGHAYGSTPSIGLTIFGEAADTVEVILKQADMAMYEAKATGRNRICIHQPAS